MDKFYSIVVIVAFVVLVVALIGLGVMLQKQDDATVFPPVQNQCPDGWTPAVANNEGGTDATGVCLMDTTYQKNKGTFDPVGLTVFDKKYLVNVNNTAFGSGSSLDPARTSGKYVVRFNSAALPCDKKKWANAHGIIWDGISNYNQC